MNILKTEKIRKSFGGVRAVNDLTLEFKPGEITGLIGPNGSGKTTLINLLTGIFPFDSGIVILGDDLKVSKIKSHQIFTYGITRTFQEVRLFGQMSVLDNVLLTLTERNIWSALFEKHKDWHIEEAEKVLKRVGLYEKKNDLAENLSYGQRKLLEVARALAAKAEIYFFDEPFAGLFPEMLKLLGEIMLELKHAGKTVILVEHNMELIRKLSDHVVVLDAGEILAEGSPEQALSKPEVLEAYLGE
jgi:ABC-type branched-subunit amino acid transport system ATPase component